MKSLPATTSPWAATAKALNQQAPVVLRSNDIKIKDRKQLQEVLKTEGVETDFAAQTTNGLKLRVRKNIFSNISFQSGFFEVQDGASQMVAPLLDVSPGQRVVDACAGAGGKTLHLAALMKNRGQIIALDIYDTKLEELRRRANRAGVSIIETRLIESSKTIKRLHDSADRLLLDVPCSGLGVLRRNPDAKWKLTPQKMQTMREIQKDILERYSKILKPGGKMVYATCSCLPSENEEQVSQFLSTHPEFKLLSQTSLPVGQNDYDGFFAACLERAAT
jgi:16S rRNA (cytosine967-C5)-methyltransferase